MFGEPNHYAGFSITEVLDSDVDEIVRVTPKNTIHNDTIVSIEGSRCKFSKED